MKRQSARFARPPRAGFGRTRYGGCLPPPGSATPTCSNDSASDRVPHAGRHLALVSDLGVGPIRVVGLLDSATHRPAVTVFGRDTYPDLGDTAIDPLLHFIETGVLEERSPHPLVDVKYILSQDSGLLGNPPQIELLVDLLEYDLAIPSPYFDPAFPRPIKLGTGKRPPVAWVESEVDAYIAARIEASRQAA